MSFFSKAYASIPSLSIGERDGDDAPLPLGDPPGETPTRPTHPFLASCPLSFSLTSCLLMKTKDLEKMVAFRSYEACLPYLMKHVSQCLALRLPKRSTEMT